MPPNDGVLKSWYEAHRAFLWGLSYRITGSAADADDVVQDTFMRAWQRAPERLDDPRGWLTRVAVNAARDVLRRRKRRAYVGPWLPTPIDTTDAEGVASFEPTIEGRTLEGRYDLLESVSLAFLQALEALTPTQRAVLLLRDVFDYSAAEVGQVIDASEANVRTIHVRARRAMATYERHRAIPTPATRAQTDGALRQFLALLNDADVAGIERMLADDVRATTDAGGEFTALFRPLAGRAAVARFFSRFGAAQRHDARIAIRSINGFPTADITLAPVGRRPPRLLLSVELEESGRISAIRVIASSTKLAAVA